MNALHCILLTTATLAVTGCSKVTDMVSSTPSTCDQIYQQEFKGYILSVEHGEENDAFCSAVITANGGGIYKLAYKLEATYQSYESGRYTYEVLTKDLLEQVQGEPFSTDLDDLKEITTAFHKAGRADTACLNFWNSVTEGKIAYEAQLDTVKSCKTPERLIDAWHTLDRALKRNPNDYAKSSEICEQLSPSPQSDKYVIHQTVWYSTPVGECQQFHGSRQDYTGRLDLNTFKYEAMRGGGYRIVENSIKSTGLYDIHFGSDVPAELASMPKEARDFYNAQRELYLKGEAQHQAEIDAQMAAAASDH